MATKNTETIPADVEPPVENLDDGASDTALEALAADTPEEEIHQRAMVNKAGQPVMRNGEPLTLDYVTARFVQDRLDSSVGPSRWQSMFEGPLPSEAVRCGIGILIQRATGTEWVWKWDVGVPSTIEADKGAHSDAFKRAGVQWGIARDLYDERDGGAEASVPVAAVAADAPIRQTIAEQAGAVAPAPVAPSADSAWVCPTHNEVKIVPGGVSRRTGRAYKPFYACPVPGCDEKGNSVGA